MASSAARSLLSAAAVRERAHELLALARAGKLTEWRLDESCLGPTADLVAEVIRDQYPDLDIPFHARWRHFVAGQRDLWAAIEATAAWRDPADRARSEFDLAIVSVLLDAGAGPDWSYHDAASGVTAGRSEGLAIASLRQFQSGAFSGNPRRPLRADAITLTGLSAASLASGFQVDPDNPMVGLDGRAALLQRLGRQAIARADLFGVADTPRPGGLYDVMAAHIENGRLPAPVILEVLLDALGPIWEGRLELGGVPLGDTWRHPAIVRDDETTGLMPIHKLSQWLAYSLIEPLQNAGVEVVDIDGLTGLAEYRNGGLFIDMGVLTPLRAPSGHTQDVAGAPAGRSEVAVGDLKVVEWRALTVALLDEIAPLVRTRLGVSAADFPLARILEGGTWAAGRRIAAQRRPGGPPPLNIVSDGTVF